MVFSVLVTLMPIWASLVAQLVKNPPAMWETWFDPRVGNIPWRKKCNPPQYSCLENSMERDRLQSMEMQRVRQDCGTNFHFHLHAYLPGQAEI